MKVAINLLEYDLHDVIDLHLHRMAFGMTLNHCSSLPTSQPTNPTRLIIIIPEKPQTTFHLYLCLIPSPVMKLKVILCVCNYHCNNSLELFEHQNHCKCGKYFLSPCPSKFIPTTWKISMAPLMMCLSTVTPTSILKYNDFQAMLCNSFARRWSLGATIFVNAHHTHTHTLTCTPILLKHQ